MVARFFVIGCFALALGCSREHRPTSVAETNPASTAPEPLDAAEQRAVLEQLTQAVRRYSMERQQVPKTLESLVTDGYLAQVPPAPAGKKFAITKDLRVTLVGL